MRRLGQSIMAGPFFVLAFAALAVWCLTATRDQVVPIALAVLSWFLINGLTAAILRTRVGGLLPRWLARIISVGLLFGSIAIAAQSVAVSLSDLTDELTIYGNPLFIRAWYWLAGHGLSEHLTKEALLERFAGEGGIQVLFEQLRAAVSNTSLIFLYTLFLLVDDRYFDAKLAKIAGDEPSRLRLRGVFEEIGRETGVYLWLMTLVSAGVGVCTFAACISLGVQAPALWGFIAFGLNYIPTIGSLLGVAIPVAFAALTTGDPAIIFLLTAILGLVQFLAGELVVPRLMGDRMNLSTFVILLALVAWGAIWGPAGMFLAVPITVIMLMVFAKFRSTRPIAILLSRTGEVPTQDWPEADAHSHEVDPETGEMRPRPPEPHAPSFLDPKGAMHGPAPEPPSATPGGVQLPSHRPEGRE